MAFSGYITRIIKCGVGRNIFVNPFQQPQIEAREDQIVNCFRKMANGLSKMGTTLKAGPLPTTLGDPPIRYLIWSVIRPPKKQIYRVGFFSTSFPVFLLGDLITGTIASKINPLSLIKMDHRFQALSGP